MFEVILLLKTLSKLRYRLGGEEEKERGKEGEMGDRERERERERERALQGCIQYVASVHILQFTRHYEQFQA